MQSVSYVEMMNKYTHLLQLLPTALTLYLSTSFSMLSSSSIALFRGERQGWLTRMVWLLSARD
ncbi:hypothetical protein CPC08DRAFT_717394, partial [Agrocybe pediades]